MSISKAKTEKLAAKKLAKKLAKKTVKLAAKAVPVAPAPTEEIDEEAEDDDAQISLNPEFSFEVQGDALETKISTLSTWKFAKDACLKKRMGVLASTLDEKIERTRSEMVPKEDDGEEEEADEETDEQVVEEEDEPMEEDIELDQEQNDLFNAVTTLSDSEEEEEEIQDTLRDKVCPVSSNPLRKLLNSLRLLVQVTGHQKSRHSLTCVYLVQSSRESQGWDSLNRLLFKHTPFLSQ
jgi:hypothetical protein